MTNRADRLALGIVGLGKIARDQHVAASEECGEFRLVATADPAGAPLAVAHFPDIGSLLESDSVPEAIAVCTPPQDRYRVARTALLHGCHVLLEKPPGTTLGEVEALHRLAEASGLTLFCAWHSQFAAAVESARSFLANRRVRTVRIEWREDVRVWHPGQRWIWQPGGFGVFDPGINALSIAVAILPEPFFLIDARLRYPENLHTPIAAELQFSDAKDAEISAAFDFLQTGPQTWSMSVVTDSGTLELTHGGERLCIDARRSEVERQDEYPALYSHFAALIRARRCDVDLLPLQLVCDALARGHRITTAPFHDRSAA